MIRSLISFYLQLTLIISNDEFDHLSMWSYGTKISSIPIEIYIKYLVPKQILIDFLKSGSLHSLKSVTVISSCSYEYNTVITSIIIE